MTERIQTEYGKGKISHVIQEAHKKLTQNVTILAHGAQLQDKKKRQPQQIQQKLEKPDHY